MFNIKDIKRTNASNEASNADAMSVYFTPSVVSTDDDGNEHYEFMATKGNDLALVRSGKPLLVILGDTQYELPANTDSTTTNLAYKGKVGDKDVYVYENDPSRRFPNGNLHLTSKAPRRATSNLNKFKL